MPLTTQTHWPVALAALEPHEKARDLIAECAEVSESLNKPGYLDASDRRMRDALESWFACNSDDAEYADFDGDHAEMIRLAASLQAVLDRLDAVDRAEQDHSAEH